MMVKVQIVLFDGFDPLDAMAPYEVFWAAAMMADNISVELVTAEGARSVPSGISGLKIESSGQLNPGQAGIILVPGAAGEVDGDGPHSVPAILSRAMNTELTDMMRQALRQQGITVATVCGGSLLLAMGGLLEGRPVVTHRLGMDFLGATGAVPIPARVVDDGNLVSGGGVTSGLDVALHLVEREIGPKVAHAVEELFEFERRGTVWKDKGIATRSAANLKEHESHNAMDSVKITNDPQDYKITPASAFDGDWETFIATPIGKLQVKLSITSTNGRIQGQATQGNQTLPLINPALEEGKLTWALRIMKPMRLNLKFEVTVVGDHMTGLARAGMLPASKLTGKRIS